MRSSASELVLDRRTELRAAPDSSGQGNRSATSSRSVPTPDTAPSGCCANILTGENSQLTDIDHWPGRRTKPSTAPWTGAGRARVLPARIEPFIKRVHTFMGESDVFFTLQGPAPRMFDFIYVDGGHRAENVLRDAIHADYALKPGGILAFDDYGWWEAEGKHLAERPKAAIDAFWEARQWDYEILSWDYQVWLQQT